jgi:hypothetical protein
MVGMFLVLRARILAQRMVKVNRANNHDMWVPKAGARRADRECGTMTPDASTITVSDLFHQQGLDACGAFAYSS